MMPHANYLNRAEAADYLASQGLPVAKTTLGKLASIGGGPRYYKFGSRAVYTPDDLLKWAESRLGEPRRHTSDVA